MTESLKQNAPSNIIVHTNRFELIDLLNRGLNLLNKCYYQTDSIINRERIGVAIEMLENLLKIQGYDESGMSDGDFDGMVTFVHDTIESVRNRLV